MIRVFYLAIFGDSWIIASPHKKARSGSKHSTSIWLTGPLTEIFIFKNIRNLGVFSEILLFQKYFLFSRLLFRICFSRKWVPKYTIMVHDLVTSSFFSKQCLDHEFEFELLVLTFMREFCIIFHFCFRSFYFLCWERNTRLKHTKI